MRFRTYLVISGIALGAMLAVLSSPGESSIFGPLVMVPAASAPILLVSLYLSTIRRIHRLGAFSENSLLRRIHSGYWVRFVCHFSLATVAGTLLVIQSMALTAIECALLISLIPIHWIVWRVAERLLANQWKPVYRQARVLGISRWSSAALMVLLTVAVNFANPGEQMYQGLGAAIEAQRALLGEPGPAALLNLLLDTLAFWNGVKAYAAQAIAGSVDGLEAIAANVGFALGSFAYYAAAATLLSAPLVQPHAYRRIFVAVTTDDTDEVPPVLRGRILLTTAIATIGWVFLYPQLAAVTERHLRDDSVAADSVAEIERRTVEFVDGHACLPGTIETIRMSGLRALGEIPGAVPAVEAVIVRAFDAMETRVDPFLDWYYSLPAEYGRILHLLAGDLESEIEGRLRESLGEGDQFAAIQAEIDTRMDVVRAAHEARVAAALARGCGRVEPQETPLVVTADVALADIKRLEEPEFLAETRRRLTAGTAAGGAGAIVATIVAKKLVAKGSVKLAASAAIKVAASKAVGMGGGTAVGATIGGTIGSVIPVVGTAIGAFVGGALGGLAAGVTVDYTLLKLDEQFSREKFRQDILESLNHTEAEYLASLESGATASN